MKSMDVEKKIKDLKITIPTLSKPVGAYVPAVKSGNFVYTSGQLPFVDGRLIFKGRVGKEVTTENAQKAAKAALINALAAIQWLLRDLNKIRRILKLTGYVCSAVGYNDQAVVMNAASELLLQIFGNEIGAHARTTIGNLELPMGSCLELDLMVEVHGHL